MSGHNKWSKIKRQKEKTDAQKSRVFGKLIRMISVETKKAKGDINSPSLRSAIEKARSMNVPNDSIERAVKKADNETDGMEKIIYETYGPGGTAIIIEALTSNRNKASQEIKYILSKYGLSLAAIGSATWAFENTVDGWRAKTSIDISENDMGVLENLIDELEDNDEVQDVFTNTQ